MKNWVKILLIIIILGATIGGGVAYFMWNKPHENVVDAKPALTYTADNLVADVAADTAAFKQKANNQIIQVSGKIRVVAPTDSNGAVIQLVAGDYGLSDIRLSIDPGFMDGVNSLKADDSVTVKGIYTGASYEDVLESWTVDLSRCVLVR